MGSGTPAKSQPAALEDLPFHLARTALAFRRFNDRTLRSSGLKSQPPGMASVLHALAGTERCTVNSLVDQTHLPNGTLTGLLDKLEREGCIERVRNPSDGRSWHVRLTNKGRALCAKVLQRHRLVMRLFRSEFSDVETAQLKHLLVRANARMRAYKCDDSTP